MNKIIEIVTLAVVIVSIIVSVFLAWYSVDESSKKSQEIIDTMKEEIGELNKKESASIEKDFSDFQPKLEYRIFSTSEDNRIPYSIHAEITNKGNELTFVKNRWTVTGEICNSDGTSKDFDYDYLVKNELVLEKDEEESIDFVIPRDFFEKFPDKTAFLLKLELKMNPYLPSLGLIETREFDEMAFIQYDFNEERGNKWLVEKIFLDLDCTGEPSTEGQVLLNTSSDDFGEYGQWWRFPEE